MAHPAAQPSPFSPAGGIGPRGGFGVSEGVAMFGHGAASATGLLTDDQTAFGAGNLSFFADGRQSAGEFRKEGKTQLPKLETSGQAGSAGPSAVIRGFEVWALKVGLVVESGGGSQLVAGVPHGFYPAMASLVYADASAK
eukprot:3018012-Amphidinium_carterae.1